MQASWERCATSLATPQNGQTTNFINGDLECVTGCCGSRCKTQTRSGWLRQRGECRPHPLLQGGDPMVQFHDATSAVHRPVARKDLHGCACDQWRPVEPLRPR